MILRSSLITNIKNIDTPRIKQHHSSKLARWNTILPRKILCRIYERDVYIFRALILIFVFLKMVLMLFTISDILVNALENRKLSSKVHYSKEDIFNFYACPKT